MTDTTNTRDKLRLGLFLLRISTGMFFLVWSIDKFVNSAHTIRVFEKFYSVDISSQVSFGLGILQTAIVLAFMIGLFRPWSTLALLAMHTVSVGSTWAHLIAPYAGGPGLVFWAGVPVWFGLLLLYLMRDEDTLGTVKISESATG